MTVYVPPPERPDRRTVQDAVQSLGLPPADDHTADQLADYLALLRRWNRVYNLTAVRKLDDMLSHHLADCLAVLAPLRRFAEGRTLRILDVGSGGGLPGVVLAIMQPDWQVTCIDAVAKKAGFVRQVGAELGLRNLHARHGRVQEAFAADVKFDVVTSRAFASLADFTNWTTTLLADSAVWMAMKGHLTDEERVEVPTSVQLFHVEQLQVPGLDAQRCLVWMRPSRASAD